MRADGKTTAPVARSGRPRDPHIDSAVLDATLAVLTESGYNHLRLEEVARRAGTTKPAIYRRWPTRQHLVLAALARRLGEVQVPNTGCTLCDLGEGIGIFLDTFHRLPPDVLGSLLADCAGEPKLRAAFMTTLFDPPRAAVAAMLDQARTRGDLRADLDGELALDLLGSFVHYRALFGHAPTSAAEIEGAVETLLMGMAVDYPALLAHSRALEAAASDHHDH
jgi:AcrR family transcriptional regulator